jgi:type I restriction enzyme R subunit
MPAYEAIAEKFDEALELLREIAPNQSVNDLESEDEDLFVQASGN